MLTESEFKTKLAKHMRKVEGGYGRRLEDSFAVGVFDMILIPKFGPVFFAEVKIVRSPNWGPTPRQLEELERIQRTQSGAIPILIGYRHDKTLEFRPHQSEWGWSLATEPFPCRISPLLRVFATQYEQSRAKAFSGGDT